MGGNNLHLALFQQGANILTLSKGEDEAKESLDYSRFMHAQLPDFLRLPIGKDQESLITFPSMYSKLRALPTTESGGVGFGGATRVVFDEFEYHKYAKENYAEIYPAVERGGQLIILSTADRFKVDTKFKELYIAAKSGDNNFYPIFFPYDVIPERNQEWYDNIDMAEGDKECRFPRTEQDALATSKSRRFLDQDALASMKRDAPPPIPHELARKYGECVRIVQLPVIGRGYCILTDPSDGKEDPHAIFVMDRQTGMQVAGSHGKTTADVCAQIHDELVRLYNNAFNSYELNARCGGLFDAKIRALNTPNVAPFVKADGKLDYKKKGWWTGGTLKHNLVWQLEEAIRLYQIRVTDTRFLDELERFIIPEGEDPRAPSGGHDDCIVATGGCWQIAKYMPMSDFKITSTRYEKW